MRNFLIKNKKTILKILMLIGIMVAIGALVIGVFLGTGIMKWNNGIEFNTALFDSVKGHWWFRLVWIIIQVILTTLLCFVPAMSMAFIIASVALFGANWITFITCFIGVILSSITMDLIGRFGGERIVIKLIGKKDYNKAYKLVNEKGLVYIPVMYLLPIFPDDAICMCCGVMRIKFILHLIYIVTCRGIGCATIVFGLELIPYKEFKTFYEWFVLITVIIIWLVIILYICNKLNDYLEKRRNDKKNKK